MSVAFNHYTQLKPLADVSVLNSHKHVIGQSWDEGKRDQLVGVEMVARYGIPQVEGPAELVRGDVAYTNTQYATWRTRLSWWNGPIKYYHEFVDRYHKNESWFLHDATGKRLVSVSGGRSFYLMNPNNPDFCKRYWLDTKAIMDANGWKHALADNVGRDTTKLHEAPNGGAVEYKDAPYRYRDGWKQFGDIGKLVLGADRLVLGNFIGDYDEEEGLLDLLDHYDGCLLEQSCGIPWPNKRKDWTVEKALRGIQHTQEAIQTGKHVLCTLQCLSTDTAEYRAFAVACYLLVADKHSSVRMVNDGNYGAPPIRVAEMQLDLGKPLNSFKIAGKVVSRLFEHYFIAVNLETKQYSFTEQEPRPDPADPRDAQIAALQEQVRGVLEREQQHKEIIAELQKTVSDMQTRLNTATIQINGSLKI